VARVNKAQTSEDIWHLGIDDLLAAPKEQAHLAGAGPFVINLTTSTSSIPPAPKGLRGFAGMHLYQLRRGPEDQPRFLLRLGIIGTEIEADAILSSVLEHYPGATKDSAEDDDRDAVAAKAPSAEPPKPAQPPAEHPPEARKQPNAAPLAPTVTVTAEEAFHWDVDELLPGLAVTRASRREQQEPKDLLPVVPPPVTDAALAQTAAVEQISAEGEELAAAASPAQCDLPPEREPPATRESLLPSEQPESSVPFDPPTSESTATDAAAPSEIEAPVPEPVEAAPTRGVAAEIDYDSNAATHEVEIPTFTFEAPEIEVLMAAATQVEAPPPHDGTSPVESDALDAITVEAPTIDMALAEAPTVEAHALDQIIAETLPVSEAAASEDHDLRDEQTPQVAMELAFAVVPDTTAAAPAPLAPVAAPVDDIPEVATAPAAREEAGATDAVDAPADSAAQSSAESAAESAPNPVSDSGTLERLVAKIGALVDSADAHDRDTTSPQNPESRMRAPALPPEPVVVMPLTRVKPAIPIAARAIAPPAERPSPPPRVPAMEVAPVNAQVIDSTQTIRALTALELRDDESSQWFSIQLVLSDEHIDLEHVPSLDIFNEYRLYTVTGLDDDRVMHALRLGFFSSALAAEAVAGYMRGFFDSPSIKRVSLAERERFAETGVTGRKDIGATGLHTVIEMASPIPLPGRRGQAGGSSERRARGSIWSRLVAPLRR
jgi:hypothetical protein